MLIDDSDADNFIHERRVKKMGITDRIVVRNDGRQGLEHLRSAEDCSRPDMLFLDINMPVMDGWEFLDAYEQLPPHNRARVTIVMLTSSVADSDHVRADSYNVIDGKIAKPLTEEKLRELLDRHGEAIAR